MAVAVGDGTAVDNHRIVQHGSSVKIFCFLQTFQESCESRHVELVNGGNFLRQFGLALIVSQMVVTFANAQHRKGSITTIVGQQQRCDTRSIRLKCQDQHVEHQVDVLTEVRRNSGRRQLRNFGCLLMGFGCLETQLQFTDDVQVFLEFVHIAGAQLFTAGQTTLPMAINDSNTSLANVLNPLGFTNTGGPARLTAFNALRGLDLSSNYVAAASHVTDLAMQANTALQAPGDTTTTFPNTSIGRQLRQVARLIKKRTELNVNRQIFYVQIGGFDTHTGEPAQHVNLFGQFSQAARAFYDELGTVSQNVQNDVALCTLSDFGRTMQPSGSGTGVGTDHAWGNHMIVIGGSVLGGNFYGMNTATNGTPFPHLQLGGLDDTDTGTNPRGRWIPSTSVDQYAATIARWFGLPENEMASVFPNIGNFSTSNLGFMP